MEWSGICEMSDRPWGPPLGFRMPCPLFILDALRSRRLSNCLCIWDPAALADTTQTEDYSRRSRS